MFCPRDSYSGWWHAPSFVGWLFRISLEYVAPMWDREAETRRNLRSWVPLLREFGGSTFAEVVEEVATRPVITIAQGGRGTPDMKALVAPEEVQGHVRRAFGDDYVNASYVWDIDGET